MPESYGIARKFAHRPDIETPLPDNSYWGKTEWWPLKLDLVLAAASILARNADLEIVQVLAADGAILWDSRDCHD